MDAFHELTISLLACFNLFLAMTANGWQSTTMLGGTRTFVAKIFHIQYIYPLNDPWRRRRHHHHHHKTLFGGVALLLLNINFCRFNARALYVVTGYNSRCSTWTPPHIWEIYAISFTSVEQGGKTVFLHCIVAYICYMLHVVYTWEFSHRFSESKRLNIWNSDCAIYVWTSFQGALVGWMSICKCEDFQLLKDLCNSF